MMSIVLILVNDENLSHWTTTCLRAVSVFNTKTGSAELH